MQLSKKNVPGRLCEQLHLLNRHSRYNTPATSPAVHYLEQHSTPHIETATCAIKLCYNIRQRMHVQLSVQQYGRFIFGWRSNSHGYLFSFRGNKPTVDNSLSSGGRITTLTAYTAVGILSKVRFQTGCIPLFELFEVRGWTAPRLFPRARL